MDFNKEIDAFIKACNIHGVRLILVGGSAVNFHGYQRHSADVDFWLDIHPNNLENLRLALADLGYNLGQWPPKILKGQQNISLKLSPQSDLELELITSFNPGKTFEEAYADSVQVKGKNIRKYQVLSFDDLIASKIKSARPKDLLDVQELKRINK